LSGEKKEKGRKGLLCNKGDHEQKGGVTQLIGKTALQKKNKKKEPGPDKHSSEENG